MHAGAPAHYHTMVVLYIPCTQKFTNHFTELFQIFLSARNILENKKGRVCSFASVLILAHRFFCHVWQASVYVWVCMCVSVCDHLVNFVASHLPAVSVAPSVPTAQQAQLSSNMTEPPSALASPSFLFYLCHPLLPLSFNHFIPFISILYVALCSLSFLPSLPPLHSVVRCGYCSANIPWQVGGYCPISRLCWEMITKIGKKTC